MPLASAEIDRLFADIAELAPVGYAAGLHVRFLVPVRSVNTYPQAWQDRYVKQVYGLRDPMIAWAFSTTGAMRWSEVPIPDPFGVLSEAGRYGLRYGASIATGRITSRSVVGCARDDREFTGEELARLTDIVEALHEVSEPAADLTPAQIEALTLIASGHRHTAAAATLGISESALKARLVAARDKLSARTIPEAVQKAKDYRLL